MNIQKIIHIHQPLEETKNRLSNLWSYRHHLEGVERALISNDGESFFQLNAMPGFQAQVRLERVVLEDENQVGFRSVGGNVEVVGVIQFHEIKENLTEVEIHIDYEIEPAIPRLMDRLFRGVDAFFNHQFDAIRSHFQGISIQHHAMSSAYHRQAA